MKKKMTIITTVVLAMICLISGCGNKAEGNFGAAVPVRQGTELALKEVEESQKKPSLKTETSSEQKINPAPEANQEPVEEAEKNPDGESGAEKNREANNAKETQKASKDNKQTGSKEEASQPDAGKNVPENSGESNPDPQPSESVPQAPEQTPESAPAPSEPAHTHEWIPQTQTVNHEATGHYETRVVQEAWDEPVYEARTICNKCGVDITDNVDMHYAFECDGSYSNKNVQTGTTHHEAVTEQVWVEDTAAWTETVTVGYTCSCGATK